MATNIQFHRLCKGLRSFHSAERGNVLLTFALALIPIMAAVGAAVDYSLASKARTELLAASDAAAVGSIANFRPGMTAATTMLNDGPITAGQTDATNIFNALIKGRTDFTNASPSVSVVRSLGSVNATVSFTAKVPMKFMGLFGTTSMTISGTSKASNSVPLFADFYVLLDNTPSMGVAATPADVTTMVNNTPDQCAFACHDLSNANNYYNLAKSLGVTMRIDVLRTATQQLMDTAAKTEIFSNQFRMAIYTFGASATSPGLTSIQTLTSNMSTAKSSAATIDLMTVPYPNYRDDTQTDFGDVLTNINTAITTPGTGTTSASPMKFVFFVSDGVADRALGSPACSQPTTTGKDPQTQVKYVRCQEPLDVSFCTTMKNRGIKIAVLYTTYWPLPTNAWYNSWIAPFNPPAPATSQIATNMQNCASPGLYFEVSPTQGISDAMNALFQKAVAEAHLTQ
jgi:Flp pilus assembly protein TadG